MRYDHVAFYSTIKFHAAWRCIACGVVQHEEGVVEDSIEYGSGDPRTMESRANTEFIQRFNLWQKEVAKGDFELLPVDGTCCECKAVQPWGNEEALRFGSLSLLKNSSPSVLKHGKLIVCIALLAIILAMLSIPGLTDASWAPMLFYVVPILAIIAVGVFGKIADSQRKKAMANAGQAVRKMIAEGQQEYLPLVAGSHGALAQLPKKDRRTQMLALYVPQDMKVEPVLKHRGWNDPAPD